MSEARVISNRGLGGPYYKMALEWRPAAGVEPGQFVMLRVSDSLEPLLRRPFSICGVIGKGAGIELLYKVVGRGTAMMSELKKGAALDILGPLGNGFPAVREPARLIMAAGGIGIAPFHMMIATGGRRLRGARLFYGARTKTDAALCAGLKKGVVAVRVATEDGSVGIKGLVTDILERETREDSVVYACGPSGMLKAVSALARARGAAAYVSLERAMACGIGVCLGCAVKTKQHGTERKKYKMVCSDGPVFKSDEIDWERI